jgi:hypothetical protein
MEPRFVVPPHTPSTGYYHQQGSSAVWLLKLAHCRRAKIGLAGAWGLPVRSNDPSVVPSDFYEKQVGDLRILELYAKKPGTSLIEVQGRNGSVVAVLQVQVSEIPRGKRGPVWIKLDAPQVALNSPNAGTRFRMTYSPVIPWDWSIDRMLDEAVPEGVNHLIFNCHGIPTGGKRDFPAPHLSIGTAIHPGNVGAFSKLSPREDLCVIWLSACNVADGGAGSGLCQQIANLSRCYVVAHMVAVADVAIRSGHIQDYVDSYPVYFQPGDLRHLTRGEFFEMGPDLGFEHV